MTDAWVREEAGRQLLAWRSSKYDPSERTLAESCLRAGLAHQTEAEEAIRRVEFERGKRAGLAYQAEAVRELRAAITTTVVWLEAGHLRQPQMMADHLRGVLARYPEEPGQGGTTP